MKKQIRQARIVGWKPLLLRKILPHGALIDISIGDAALKIRARTPDLFVAVENMTGEYDFIDRYLGPEFDGVIVDAGAYIGSSTVFFARKFPKATVVALEPEPGNHEILSVNTRGYDNIVLKQAALSSEGGQAVNLKDSARREWGYSIVGDDEAADNARVVAQVQTISLEDIRNELGREIGFLKMDIEGAEKQVLDGAGPVLADIPLVFAELHDKSVPGCTDAFRRFSKDREIVTFGGEKFLSVKS